MQWLVEHLGLAGCRRGGQPASWRPRCRRRARSSRERRCRSARCACSVPTPGWPSPRSCGVRSPPRSTSPITYSSWPRRRRLNPPGSVGRLSIGRRPNPPAASSSLSPTASFDGTPTATTSIRTTRQPFLRRCWVCSRVSLAGSTSDGHAARTNSTSATVASGTPSLSWPRRCMGDRARIWRAMMSVVIHGARVRGQWARSPSRSARSWTESPLPASTGRCGSGALSVARPSAGCWATPARPAPWPSARIASCSPPRAMTASSGCGLPAWASRD